jgi:hypothetical protein
MGAVVCLEGGGMAAITKHDRFKWIRHKQYYNTQLNPYP